MKPQAQIENAPDLNENDNETRQFRCLLPWLMEG